MRKNSKINLASGGYVAPDCNRIDICATSVMCASANEILIYDSLGGYGEDDIYDNGEY